MRVKPLVTLMLASGVSGVTYSFKEKLMSFWPFSGGKNNQDQPPIPHKPLPIDIPKPKFAAPKIDISKDLRDHSSENLSLEDLQQLDTDVQDDRFVGHVIWGTLPSGEVAHSLRKRIEQKVIQNNQNYQRYPSDFIHGLFSLHAYQTSDEIGIPVTFEKAEYHHYEPYLAQWRINSIHDYPQYSQYYAASYYNREARQLVLAHRGTTATLSDLWSKDSPLKVDLIGVLAGEIVDQQRAAYVVTKEVAIFAKENNYNFSTTGHSLGAWLAELSLYWSVFDFKVSAKAVTFDSPGSIKMEEFRSNIVNSQNHREIEDLDITTYLSDPNFVNTCHRHIGQVYRLHPKYEKPPIPGNKFIKFLSHPGFQSIWGHSLAPLVATFDPQTGKPKKFELMADWPVTTYKPLNGVAHNLITDAFGRAEEPQEARLFTSLVSFVGDIWTGRIDQKQYLSCWKQLQKPLDGRATAEELIFSEFTFKYESRYAFLPQDPQNAPLMVNRKGSTDWYLKKLAECSSEKISENFGEDSLITQQLIVLKNQYKVTINESHYEMMAKKDISVETIKENLSRLLDNIITQGKVRDFLATHQHKPWVKTAGLKLASHLPIPVDTSYIVKGDELERIDQLFSAHRCVILSGEPGIGKTSLATEYGRRQKTHPEHPQTVIRIDADNPEKIVASYRVIANQLGLDTERLDIKMVIRLVHGKISLNPEKVLLLLDHVQDPKHIEQLLTELPDNTKALITTTNTHLIGGIPTFHVQPFNHQQARQYIKSSTINDRISSPQEIENLITYCARNTGSVLPYYLDRAINLIKQQPIGGIPDYLSRVKNHPDDEGEILLLQKLMANSPFAWPMLQYASFLDPDFIDLTIFEQLLNVDKKALNEAIKKLESLSAIRIVRRNGQEGLSLQRLTQGIVRHFIDIPAHQEICLQKTEIASKLLTSLDSFCPDSADISVKNWLQAEKFIPHIETILASPALGDRRITAVLHLKVGEYAKRVLGSEQKALTEFQKALNILNDLYPKEANSLLATTLEKLGLSHAYLNQPEQSRLHLERSIKMWRQLPVTADTRRGLAEALNSLGFAHNRLSDIDNKQEALRYRKEALKIREELYLGQPHTDLAISLNDVGVSYSALKGKKNLEDGLEYKKQAVNMMRVLTKGEPNPRLASFLNNLGDSYEKLGDPSQALAYMEESLAMKRAFYKNLHHPKISLSLSRIGAVYAKSSDPLELAKALEFHQQALAKRQAFYQNQPHEDIVKSLRNVGNVLIKLKQQGKADIYLKQAEEMQQKLNQKPL